MSLGRRALLGGLPALAAAPSWGQERSSLSSGAPRPDPLPPPVSRPHTLVLRRRTLRFTLTAGSVTLGDGQGVAQAAVGYVA